MKKFAGHYLFPGTISPIPKGIVEVDEKGMIIQVINPKNNFQEMAGMEFHNGIICPEFVNPFNTISLEEFLKNFPELKDFARLLPVTPASVKDLFEWMKAIQQQDASILLEDLIQIFTIRSAELINKENELGSIAPGLQPGLLLISQMDYASLRLTSNSKLKKLI